MSVAPRSKMSMFKWVYESNWKPQEWAGQFYVLSFLINLVNHTRSSTLLRFRDGVVTWNEMKIFLRNSSYFTHTSTDHFFHPNILLLQHGVHLWKSLWLQNWSLRTQALGPTWREPESLKDLFTLRKPKYLGTHGEVDQMMVVWPFQVNHLAQLYESY